MKNIRITTLIVTIVMPLLLLAPVSAAQAEGQATAGKPLLISEISPGTTNSASQEFIEIYNQSPHAIDLGAQHWQLQITSSKATNWDRAKIVSLEGTLTAGNYLLLASDYKVAGQQKTYLQDFAWTMFKSGMSGTAGHVRLVASTAGQVVVGDVVEWTSKDKTGTPVSSAFASHATIIAKPIASDQSLKRVVEAAAFTDQFKLSNCPSPTATSDNRIVEGGVERMPVTIDVDDPYCEHASSTAHAEATTNTLPKKEPPVTLLPVSTVTAKSTKKTAQVPSANKGLAAPRITELLPNPAKPARDVTDEFIELYNENESSFDMSGYQLIIGANGGRKYIFPEGTVLRPQSFMAFTSKMTHISLSNTAGKVGLRDPLGNPLGETQQYSGAKDGQAWAYGAGHWQWTTKPTPGSANVILVPAAKTVASKKSKGASASTASFSRTQQRTTSSATPTVTVGSPAPAEHPIHPTALVVVAVFAVLYGAYEYRHDLANHLAKLRFYRDTRRKARQGA
jgi:hypothetical protein